jgi:hypothetical protein
MSPLRKGSDKVEVVSPATDAQQLAEEVHGLLETALQRERTEHWEQYAVLGPKRAQKLDEYVVEQAIRTIEQWFSVNTENLETVEPKPWVLRPPAALKKQKKVSSDRLTQADVNHWVDYWWFNGLIFEPANLRALKNIPHEFDAATEHRRRIEALLENKQKKNRHD